MHRSRLSCVLILALVLVASVSMTSCGGGGSGGSNPDLVLLGFNVPNLSGIPLNQTLIFTFSAPINPSTITPDSLRVVGSAGPFFETTVVDGNLVALLPTVPNFADYSDAGLAPDIEYTVSLTEFPAVTTIESTTGKPLLRADTFTFRTLPAPSAEIVSNIRCNGPDGILGTADDVSPSSPSFFIEQRRPIRHGVGWTNGGKSDDDGCLQNSAPGNTLYESPTVDPAAVQTGSGPGANLVCLQNEGSPRVIETLSIPRHNQQAVGNPSAVAPGLIDLPAIRVRLNEPLDPLTVEPWFNGIPVNIQLWRVALKDGSFVGPNQIETNKPIVVQSIEDTEVILVPAGPVPQGTYLVNITPSVKDLPGCPLRIDDRPDPSLHGYDVYELEPAFGAAIPPGYRIYFQTLEVPDTALSIVESFVNNLAEWGDNNSADTERGLHTSSVTDTEDSVLDGDPMFGLDTPPAPNLTTVYTAVDALSAGAGQASSAQWHSSGTATVGGPITDVNGYRFLNIPTLVPNANPTNPKPGTLQATHQPWSGGGQDGAVDSNGSSIGWDTDTGSINGDGIFEVQSFHLQAGDTLSVTGSRPLLVLCQGDFIVEGTILMNGEEGGPGFDTDGTSVYDPAGPDGIPGNDDDTGAISPAGPGGAAGPGGGAGGLGSDPIGIGNSASGAGTSGEAGNTLFDGMEDQVPGFTGGVGPAATSETVAGANDGSSGGGGGGYDGPGVDGTTNALVVLGAGGGSFGDATFSRAIAKFMPDRGYHPMANMAGGTGGAGGSADDDDGASETGNTTLENGDDGGGGGGGGGGAMWVIAKGLVDIRSTAVIEANGGVGGRTYHRNDQRIEVGEDGQPGGGDDFLSGVAGSPTVGSGDGGGPGGGGSGGALFFCGRAGVTVASGALLSATPGEGGTSGHADRKGGDGAVGRILLANFGTAPGVISNNGTVSPVAATATWNPTIDQVSVGQSQWVDLFTDNTTFAPRVPPIIGTKKFPTFNANFDLNGGGFLELPTASGGGGQVLGTDFDAKFEFQGADFLGPLPDVGMPTSADGLTIWYDMSAIEMLNGKRFFRWRWRLWARDGYGTGALDPANLPLPTVFDLTIPFTKG